MAKSNEDYLDSIYKKYSSFENVNTKNGTTILNTHNDTSSLIYSSSSFLKFENSNSSSVSEEKAFGTNYRKNATKKAENIVGKNYVHIYNFTDNNIYSSNQSRSKNYSQEETVGKCRKSIKEIRNSAKIITEDQFNYDNINNYNKDHCTKLRGKKKNNDFLSDFINKIGYNKFHLFLFWISTEIVFMIGSEIMITNVILSSIQEEWKMEDSQILLVNSVLFIGILFSSIFMNKITNNFGRRFLIISTNLIVFLFSFLGFFANNFITYSFLRFGVGNGIGILIPSLLSLIVEFIPDYKRSLYVSCIWISYPFGLIYVCNLAILFTKKNLFNWKSVCLINSFSSLLAFYLSFFISESPRYLLLKATELEFVLKNKFRKDNKKSLDEINLGESGYSKIPIDENYNINFKKQAEGNKIFEHVNNEKISLIRKAFEVLDKIAKFSNSYEKKNHREKFMNEIIDEFKQKGMYEEDLKINSIFCEYKDQIKTSNTENKLSFNNQSIIDFKQISSYKIKEKINHSNYLEDELNNFVFFTKENCSGENIGQNKKEKAYINESSMTFIDKNIKYKIQSQRKLEKFKLNKQYFNNIRQKKFSIQKNKKNSLQDCFEEHELRNTNRKLRKSYLYNKRKSFQSPRYTQKQKQIHYHKFLDSSISKNIMNFQNNKKAEEFHKNSQSLNKSNSKKNIDLKNYKDGQYSSNMLMCKENNNSQNNFSNEDYFKNFETKINSYIIFFIWFSTNLISIGILILLPKHLEIIVKKDKSETFKNIIITIWFLTPCPIIRGLLSESTLLGRKFTICISLFITAIFSLFAFLSYENLHIYLGFSAFFISVCYGILLVFTAEYFHTKIRASALAMGNSFGKLGGILAPFVTEFFDLQITNGSFLFISILSIICFSLGLFLKETREFKIK